MKSGLFLLLRCLVVCLIVVSLPAARAFTSFPDLSKLGNLLSLNTNNNNKKKNSKQGTSSAQSRERNRLKNLLLETCSSSSSSSSSNKKKRDAIQDIIDQLAPLSPIAQTASSPTLQQKWMLTWTTEKEINFFLDQGIAPSGSIYQTIVDGTPAGVLLQNVIPFPKMGGGSFRVQGELRVVSDTRTDFVFTAAVLDLGQRWGCYNLPPLGKGWFETVYLDDELRVDVNSRDDILICTAASGE